MTTEQTTYAEEYIGDCVAGSCDRPATVQVYEGYVLCALHHHRALVGEEIDAVDMALGLLKPWQAQAEYYQNGCLLKVLGRAREDLDERMAALDRNVREIDRIDYESTLGDDLLRHVPGE